MKLITSTLFTIYLKAKTHITFFFIYSYINSGVKGLKAVSRSFPWRPHTFLSNKKRRESDEKKKNHTHGKDNLWNFIGTPFQSNQSHFTFEIKLLATLGHCVQGWNVRCDSFESLSSFLFLLLQGCWRLTSIGTNYRMREKAWKCLLGQSVCISMFYDFPKLFIPSNKMISLTLV